MRASVGVTAAIVLAVTLAPTAARAAEPLTLTAEAGLGGVSKPGRWTPVRILVDNGGRDFAGELVATWGDSEVRRLVTLPSPSRKQFEVYIRTPDPEAAIRVRLVSDGADVRAADAPVRLVPSDTPVTLCAARDAATSLSSEICSAGIVASALPASARGYDAVDRVVWLSETPALSPAQRLALDRWQSLRALEDAGDLDATPRLPRPSVPRGVPAPTRRVLEWVGLTYAAIMMTAGVAFARRRTAPMRAYAMLAGLLCVGSTAALAMGKTGPASAIVVHSATLVQQLPDGQGSAVTTAGLAEFPAFDAFRLETSLDDAYFESSTPSGTVHQTFLEGGAPIIANTFTMGSRHAFKLEGFSPLAPLALNRIGSTVSVSNRSSWELTDCRFSDAFSVEHVGRVAAGQTVTATRVREVTGPVFACTLPDAAIAAVHGDREARSHEVARLVVYDRSASSRASR